MWISDSYQTTTPVFLCYPLFCDPGYTLIAAGPLPLALFEKLNELTQMMSARKTCLYFNALLSLRLARMCKKS
jgi:hypothetical protein